MHTQQWATMVTMWKGQCYQSGTGAWGQSGQQQSMVYQWGGEPPENYNVIPQHNWAQNLVSPKERGILFLVCTSSLLDIHRLLCISETFIEIE